MMTAEIASPGDLADDFAERFDAEAGILLILLNSLTTLGAIRPAAGAETGDFTTA